MLLLIHRKEGILMEEQYSKVKEINNIWLELTKFCESMNCHDGTVDANDLLDNAEYVKNLLEKYLEYDKQPNSINTQPYNPTLTTLSKS